MTGTGLYWSELAGWAHTYGAAKRIQEVKSCCLKTSGA
jgi:hypothetical protein